MIISYNKTFLWVPSFITMWSGQYMYGLFLEIFNLFENFSRVSARAVIFHMSISCDKIFPWNLAYFWKFNIVKYFWIWVLRLWCFTWVFLMTRPFCGNHHLLPYDLLIWPNFENFNLLINFEQWLQELLYFTWAFLVTIFLLVSR